MSILGEVLSTLNGGSMTVPQLAAALPDVKRQQIATAIYNGVKRGRLVNLKEGQGRKLGGLYAELEHGRGRAVRAVGAPSKSVDFAPLLGAWR